MPKNIINLEKNTKVSFRHEGTIEIKCPWNFIQKYVVFFEFMKKIKTKKIKIQYQQNKNINDTKNQKLKYQIENITNVKISSTEKII